MAVFLLIDRVDFLDSKLQSKLRFTSAILYGKGKGNWSYLLIFLKNLVDLIPE